VTALRRRSALVDHAVRMIAHYSHVRGSLQAGAITYFGFLSFFPVLALAFTFVGYLSYVYPPSRADLRVVIEEIFPGIIGGGPGQLSFASIEQASSVTGPIAFVGVLYAGLGWVSAMRDALVVVFEVDRPQPNLVVAKVRDFGVLLLIGGVLLVSVAISSLVSAFAEQILQWLTLGTELAPLVVGLTLVLGLAASTLLFFLLFKLLARPRRTPDRSLLQGALLGAVGFEVLKRLSSLLLSTTVGRPAFQAFGIALILIVWINYFARVVVLAGAWAWTTGQARELREQDEWTRRSMEELTRVDLREAPDAPVGHRHDHHDHHDHRGRGRTAGAAAAGAAAMLALVGVVRRREHP
jgi:membrane protein